MFTRVLCRIETEGLLDAACSHVHCRSSIISEELQTYIDVVITMDH